MKTISAIVAISTLPDSISSTRRLTKVGSHSSSALDGNGGPQ